MLEWYVAKVKPRAEQRIRTYLGRCDVEVYAPQIVGIKRGRQYMEPLFPGYVFVRTDPLSGMWPLVRWAKGLSHFLPAHGPPSPAGESVVAGVRIQVGRWNSGGWSDAFKPGDSIIIECGPLRTLNAIFQRHITGNERCEVLISLMERPHRVQLNITDVQNLSLRRRFAGTEV